MIKQIEFYYDFISPYSYIAHKRFLQIKKIKKIEFLYKPILLGGLHNLAKITAPALIKAKKKYLIDDCEMVSKKFNIDFKFNNKFPINSINLMRGILVVEENKKDDFINSFFNAYWSSNIDLSNEEEINKILYKLDIDKVDFFLKIKDQKIKDQLKDLTQKAFEREVFGAPTFITNNKIFWGQDRLDFAIEECEKII